MQCSVEVPDVYLGAGWKRAGEPRVGDAPLDGRAPTRARHEPDRLSIDLDGLGSHRNLLVVERDGPKGSCGGRADRERLRAYEGLIGGPHREAEAGLLGCIAARHVA